MTMRLKVTVPADAPALERSVAAAYLLGTLLSDFNLLPAEHRKQLRVVTTNLVAALDEYDQPMPRPADPGLELELEAACREIAEAFGERLPGVVFALLMFLGGGRVTYISNLPRGRMLEAMRDFLERAEAGRAG